ncbi:MAG: ankyrin repeat domain-containing protein [Spirochaetales bacterium]|nr:ankyrin repeat domain-containing protein [Spirochaetales bacterium]
MKKAEEISKLLIKYGADINKRDVVFGSTMLHAAMDLKTVRLLIELGADVNAVELKFGNTPLHAWVISYKNDLEMIQYLIEHGANVNIKNNLRKTVIDYANDRELKDSKDKKEREIYNVLHLSK